MEFPLYIESDYCVIESISLRCHKTDDFTVLFNFLKDVCLKHYDDEFAGHILMVSNEVLESLGIEIYLDDKRVEFMQYDYGTDYIEGTHSGGGSDSGFTLFENYIEWGS